MKLSSRCWQPLGRQASLNTGRAHRTLALTAVLMLRGTAVIGISQSRQQSVVSSRVWSVSEIASGLHKMVHEHEHDQSLVCCPGIAPFTICNAQAQILQQN